MSTLQEQAAKSPEKPDPHAVPAATLNLPIETLRLSTRAYRCLKAAGLHTVEHILQTDRVDLLHLPNFGARSMRELEMKLRRKGFKRNPAEKGRAKDTDLTVLLGMPIEQIGFSDAMVERMHLAQIERVGELVIQAPKNLMRYPSLGPRSIQIIRHVLNDLGLELGMDFVKTDDEGTHWMDRLDAARVWLRQALKTPVEAHLLSKEYGISRKTLRRLMEKSPLTVYESSKLRKLFSERIDLAKPFDMKGLLSYQEIMEVERTYRQAGSLTHAAKELKRSHEQVRQILKLGHRLKLFTYNPSSRH